MGMGAWGRLPPREPGRSGPHASRGFAPQWPVSGPRPLLQAWVTGPADPRPALSGGCFSANPGHSDLISHETHFWKAHSVVSPSLQTPTRCATGRINDTQVGPLDDRAAVPRAQSEPTHHAPSRNGAEAGSRVCRPGASHLGPGPGWCRRPFPEALGQQPPRPLLPPGPLLACLLSL